MVTTSPVTKMTGAPSKSIMSGSTSTTCKLLLVVLVTLLVPSPLVVTADQSKTSQSSSDLTCSLSEQLEGGTYRDPNLHEMVYDVGDGPQKTCELQTVVALDPYKNSLD